MSPTLVREALRRLEAEGLVTFDLHKGSTVVAVDYGATQENYRIRAALESLGAELAADSIEPEGDPRAGGHHRRHGGDR